MNVNTYYKEQEFNFSYFYSFMCIPDYLLLTLGQNFRADFRVPRTQKLCSRYPTIQHYAINILTLLWVQSWSPFWPYDIDVFGKAA